MPKRSSKQSTDPNISAFQIVQQATAQPAVAMTPRQMAAALGRLGGLKGGKARAAKLGPKRRREIARKAARKRWSRHA